jgi:hypothetical protein
MTHIVFGQFGVQTPTPDDSAPFLKQLRELLALPNGAVSVERCRQTDPASGNNEILMAYWTDLAGYHQWADDPQVREGWASLAASSTDEVGLWREVLSPPIDRFWFFGFVMPRVACSRFLDIRPTETFGYWGGYRDRFPASQDDHFDSDFGPELVEPLGRDTRGRSLRVVGPHNMLFVREGQESTYIDSETERKLWDNRVRPARDKWLAYLRDNPPLSGCMSLRQTIELDLDTGEELQKHNQLAYFLTLSHLERAARTEPSHLSLYNTYMDVATQLATEGTESKLYIWAEGHILPRGTLQAEYVNCHPSTGLLPYFQAEEIHF